MGDPEQLPATVLSQTALQYGYDTSLFKRLQTAGYPVQVRPSHYEMWKYFQSTTRMHAQVLQIFNVPYLLSRTMDGIQRA